MKLHTLPSLVLASLIAGTAFASANASVTLPGTTATSNSITVQYAYSGPGPDTVDSTRVDQICLILDYDSSDGFYTFAPEQSDRRQVKCFDPGNGSHTFTGLQPATSYWLTALPYIWTAQGKVQVNGSGVAGKVVRTSGTDDLGPPMLWNVVQGDFARIPVGGSNILVAREYPSKNPVLHGVKEEQLRCIRDDDAWDTENVSWVCTGLRGGNASNSEIYYTLDGEQSNAVVIQVDDGTATSCCVRPSGGGVQCEEWSRQECASRNGQVMDSCAECWESYDDDRDDDDGGSDVHCCFTPIGGGVGCEEWPRSECASRNGRIMDSCSDCWESYDSSAHPSSSAGPSRKIPPAGFEDEVLVNYDAYENPSPDTSLADLSGKAAAELYRRAVIGGFPDGEFKGNRNVNRAEAAKFLLLSRFGDVYEMQNNGRFPDVLDGQWYTKYVVMAAEKGIISGYPDGLFRPADTVNTAEFLKMLSLTFGLQLYLPHAYTDVATSDWFAPYAGIAQEYELFPGRTTLLRHGDPLSREEVAVAIYQYLNGR